MADYCTKCSLVVAPYAPKKVVGALVWHKECFESLSNWLRAQIEATQKQAS